MTLKTVLNSTIVRMATFSFFSSVLSLPLLASTVQAEPCTYQCESGELRFVPGQALKIEFVNKTNGLINLERILDIKMHWLRPHTDFDIQTYVGVDPDMSMVFWDDDSKAVNAVLHRPDKDTLQIEFLPSGGQSDRAVHISNDGRVLVF